jgi:hypothetical protein
LGSDRKDYADLFPTDAGEMAKPLKMALGSLIIKEKRGFTDRGQYRNHRKPISPILHGA